MNSISHVEEFIIITILIGFIGLVCVAKKLTWDKIFDWIEEDSDDESN